MLKTRQTENRTTKIRRFVVAATALVFGICGVKYFLSNQKQEQKIVQSIPKQRSKVRVLPLTDTLATSFANPSDQIRGRLHLMVIGRDLTQPKPYTIVLGPEQIPKIEHPLDAYSCLIEARTRKKDAVDAGKTFDEERFLMEKGCPSLGKLLLSIQTHPSEEGFDTLRRLIRDRKEYFNPTVQMPKTDTILYFLCMEGLEARNLLDEPSPLLTVAYLAVDHPQAEEILIESTRVDPYAIDMLKFRLASSPPKDEEEWDMRNRLIDILDMAIERMRGGTFPDFEIDIMVSANVREAEGILNGDGTGIPFFNEFQRDWQQAVKTCEQLGVVEN